MRIIDLSHELSGSPALVSEHLDFHSDKFEGRALVTHIEAPSYLVANRKDLDGFEPVSFVRNAVLLDLTQMKPKQVIEDEDLEAAEEGAGLALREGEVVIIQTGWEKYSKSEDYWSSHPALGESGAQYLEFKRVIGVGVDAPSIDHPENPAMPAHSILMQSDIYVLENLCNLAQIDLPRFRLISLPPKTSASVSPVRAVAILDTPY